MSLIYRPDKRGMKIACFVSGSGTNYERMYERDPSKDYFVCSNVPDCEGIKKAINNGNPVATLDSKIYFIEMSGLEKVPRRGMERDSYDRALCTLLEQTIQGQPDLICLAGYDLWIGDWMVDRYYPRILNVHPGDTTKVYKGLGWVPSALSILTEEDTIRSTVFFVDKGDDTGPVLVQSRPVPIFHEEWQKEIYEIRDFASRYNTRNIRDFRIAAENEEKKFLAENLQNISRKLQDILKQEGDWKIYPFAVHELISKGRVELDGRTVYIDGKQMPVYGYRMDEH